MAAVDMARSSGRSIVLDKDGEDFHREPVQVTGMDALLDRFQQRLAAAAEMPVTLLMGRSPAGLNATGESDLAQWNMSVQASQRKVARPAIARMLEILTAGKFDGEICFAPLEDVDEKKAADTEKVKADTWKVYVDMGALHAEQVAMAEFADEPIEIDIAAMKKAIAAEQEMALNPPPPMPPVMPPAPAPAAPPAPSPAPKQDASPMPTFAQRQASFLGDLKDMREAGLHVDQDVVDELAEKYGVTAPRLKP
jgi:hypothetical protein